MLHTMRAAVLGNYSELARRHGLDPAYMLRRVGLPVDCLQDPERPIAAEKCYRLIEESAQVSGVRSFGLEMGEANRLSTLGLLGLILREEPTLRHALSTIIHFRHLHNETLALRLDEEGSNAILRMDYVLDTNAPMTQGMELGLTMLLRSMRSLMTPAWQPRLVCLTHAPGAPRAIYQRVLNAPLRFEADFNGIVLATADLDRPAQSTDPALVHQARQNLENLLQARGAKSTGARVRELASVLLPLGRCTLEQVALHLGMHRRTLHRHLQREGMQFSDLVQEIRMQHVNALLLTSRQLTEISELLGFSSPPAFSRWYRQSFGVTAQSTRHGGTPAGVPTSPTQVGLRQR